MFIAIALSQIVPLLLFAADNLMSVGLTPKLLQLGNFWIFKYWFMAAIAMAFLGVVLALTCVALDTDKKAIMRLLLAASFIVVPPISVAIFGLYEALRASPQKKGSCSQK